MGGGGCSLRCIKTVCNVRCCSRVVPWPETLHDAAGCIQCPRLVVWRLRPEQLAGLARVQRIENHFLVSNYVDVVRCRVAEDGGLHSMWQSAVIRQCTQGPGCGGAPAALRKKLHESRAQQPAAGSNNTEPPSQLAGQPALSFATGLKELDESVDVADREEAKGYIEAAEEAAQGGGYTGHAVPAASQAAQLSNWKRWH